MANHPVDPLRTANYQGHAAGGGKKGEGGRDGSRLGLSGGTSGLRRRARGWGVTTSAARPQSSLDGGPVCADGVQEWRVEAPRSPSGMGLRRGSRSRRRPPAAQPGSVGATVHSTRGDTPASMSSIVPWSLEIPAATGEVQLQGHPRVEIMRCKTETVDERTRRLPSVENAKGSHSRIIGARNAGSQGAPPERGKLLSHPLSHFIAVHPIAKFRNPRNPSKHLTTAVTGVHGTQYPLAGAAKPTSHPPSRTTMKYGDACTATSGEDTDGE
jgi:hypothetical protein